jgi:hypothetical protein
MTIKSTEAHAATLAAVAQAVAALENGADAKAMAAYFRAVLTNAYDADHPAWLQSMTQDA